MGQENRQLDVRQEVVNTLRALVEKGLTSGTSGNVSARTEQGMLITPTGVSPGGLSAREIVPMRLDGELLGGQLAPSSEWRMHADVYAGKPEVAAIVHCHSNYATILACSGRAIPAMHYMVAGAGADHIPLAAYATFGTAELSALAVASLAQTRACLLANHGQLATGASLPEALALAELVEEQARWYWGALAIGEPVLLSDGQMGQVREAFAGYGQPQRRGDSSRE